MTIINNNTPDEVDESRNDVATYGDDTIGENTGDSALEIAAAKDEPAKPQSDSGKGEDPRVETIVPDNDN